MSAGPAHQPTPAGDELEFERDQPNNGVILVIVLAIVSTIVASVVFGAACFGMHAAMKRSFMMTVRRLAGTN